MTASETPDAVLQSPGGTHVPMETWPPELEICVEYCTRRPFHARYDPDKYEDYFQAVSDIFRARCGQTKIVGNPFTGRCKVWGAYDKFGSIAEEVDLPRLGAFEVTMNCEQTGHITIFSKLETRRWPNLRVLVIQVDRALRGEPLLQPVASPLDGSHSPRKRIAQVTELNSSSFQKSSASTASTPRSPLSPDRTSAPTKASHKRVTPGGKEASVTSRKKSEPAVDLSGVGIPSQTDAAADPYADFEESFEGDESAGDSSCFGGTKVWMPGATKSEKWEEEEEGTKDKATDKKDKQQDMSLNPAEASPSVANPAPVASN